MSQTSVFVVLASGTASAWFEHSLAQPVGWYVQPADQLPSYWRLANAPELRRLGIDDAGITVDAVETWPGRVLLDTRLGIARLDS